MKIFFEEYGMVIVVTILAVGMIAFADTFKDTLTTTIGNQWNAMITEGGQ